MTKHSLKTVQEHSLTKYLNISGSHPQYSTLRDPQEAHTRTPMDPQEAHTRTSMDPQETQPKDPPGPSRTSRIHSLESLKTHSLKAVPDHSSRTAQEHSLRALQEHSPTRYPNNQGHIINTAQFSNCGCQYQCDTQPL